MVGNGKQINFLKETIMGHYKQEEFLERPSRLISSHYNLSVSYVEKCNMTA
jgi:hypothetical protein